MKRIRKIVTAVLLTAALCAGILTGCAKNVRTEKVSVSGKDLTVCLKADPSTGRVWNYEIGNESLLYFCGEAYDVSDKDGDWTGGFDTFTFRGRGEGETSVVMTFGEQWEGGEAGRTEEIKVTLGKKGKILSVESAVGEN